MVLTICCVGDCGYDDYGGKKLVGGISFNVAAHAVKLGAQATLMSCVGQNNHANIVAAIEQKGINNCLSILPGKSAVQHIALHDGERKFTGYDKGVLPNFYLSEKEFDSINSHDVVICPLTDGLEKVFDAVKHMQYAGVKVADFSQDYEYFSLQSVKENLQYFDIAFIGGNLAMVEELLSVSYSTIVIVTMGAGGSVALFQGTSIVIPSIPTEVVDTTGCGDAFQAAFVIHYLNGILVKEALQSASKYGANHALSLGGGA